MLKVLQVCNVGNILGGTAACAWSVTRALPDCRHTIWFRSSPTAHTRAVFQDCEVEHRCELGRSDAAAGGFDVILLHNTPAAAVEWGSGQPGLSMPVLLYQHSEASRLAGADRRLLCSRWLAEQCRQPDALVVHQGVPRSPSDRPETRALNRRLVVGRICTPSSRKWRSWLPAFYAALAKSRPQIDWEFVGCPTSLRAELAFAVSGRAHFFDADWWARRRMRDWHALLYHQPGLPESFGRVCAEALRAGCVPLVDRQGGFREQLPDGTGFLCKEPEAFGAALDCLLESGEWWHRAAVCRQHGEDAFSLKAFRGRLLEQFAHVGL